MQEDTIAGIASGMGGGISIIRVSGENALTAVSLAFPLQMLLIAVATGTGVGMNALLSKALGAKKTDEANIYTASFSILIQAHFLSIDE